MLATKLVDFDVLGKLVASAFAAGIGITAIFGIGIYGGTRFADFRRDGRHGGAWLFGAVMVACLLAFAGAVALGIVIMTRK